MGVDNDLLASCLVAEQALGNALKASGRERDEYVIATKANGDCLIPDNLRATFKRSLENLQTDHIDILQIHWPNDAVPPSVYMPVIQEFIDEGSLRAVGISNHGCQDMQAVLDTGMPIISNQLPYNLLNRIVEDSVRLSFSVSLADHPLLPVARHGRSDLLSASARPAHWQVSLRRRLSARPLAKPLFRPVPIVDEPSRRVWLREGAV